MFDTVTDTTCRTADSAVSEIENDNQFINNRYIQRLTFIDEQTLMYL